MQRTKRKLNKTKLQEAGITLVALVVTIIVLLILAGVTISLALGSNGVMDRAQYASNTWANATKNETTMMEEIDEKVAELSKVERETAEWTYTHDTQTVTKGTLTLNLGDYINYTAPSESGYDSNNKWCVLGAENGQLLLVSGSNVTSSQTLQGSSGPEQWLRALNEVGGKCADNIKTENGRCLTVEDINKITGYNPLNTGVNDPGLTGTGTPYSNGELDQYGNKVTFSLKNGYVWYQGDLVNTTETKSIYKTFKLIGESNDISEPYTIENTFYRYYPETLTSETRGEDVGINATGNAEAIWNMLFLNTMNYPYYLASVYNEASNGYNGSKYPPESLKGTADWSVRAVSQYNVGNYTVLWDSRVNAVSNPTIKERAVVSLKSDITPVLSSTDEETGVSTYDI